MFVLIVGCGRVGSAIAKQMLAEGHEVTVVESDSQRYQTVEEELEHSIQYGDGSELWVLERAGIERADLVIAVTGDDEDNILISQVAREKYGVERIVARCNNPRNMQHFDLLGIKPAVSATDLILRLIEHEVPKYGLVHLLDLEEEQLEIIEMEVSDDAPAAGRRVPDVDVLLIGGGLASANCARWLREEGFDGTVALCGRELDPPYNRPPCSKGHLQGKEPREEVLFRPDAWWDEQRIDLRTRTTVTALDPAAKAATLSSGEQLSFDKALVATGANVRRLRVEGGEHDRIHYLRTLPNSDAIRADADDAEHVVVVGGSYIGTEVAASLTLLGKQVTIVMLEDVVHERSFGAQAGRFFQSVLEEHGVTVIGGDQLDRF